MKKLRPPMKAALQAVLHFETDVALRKLLHLIPADLLFSEVQRRRGAKRTTYAGPTGNWAHHNPDVKNCRCDACDAKRKEAPVCADS